MLLAVTSEDRETENSEMNEDTTIPTRFREASPGVPRHDSTRHTNVVTQVPGEASPVRTRPDDHVMFMRSELG